MCDETPDDGDGDELTMEEKGARSRKGPAFLYRWFHSDE